MADLAALIDQLDNLTLLEASELVSQLEEKWGVSAAAPAAMAMPMMAGGGGDAGGGEAAAEQTEFDVVLAEVGDKKINVIKAVRGLTSLGLKEAKEMVEGAPVNVMSGVSKDAAEEAKTALEAEGASVQIK